MEEKRLTELANKFLRGEASPDEAAELHRWWDEENTGDAEQVIVTDEPQTYDSVRDRIFASINQQIDTENQPVSKVVPFRKRKSIQWAAAAVLIMAIIALTVARINRTRHNPTPITSATQIIFPGTNKAILKLADGRIIVLDSAHAGKLLSESGTSVSKVGNDRITYTAPVHATSITYNTISTPRGGQFRVALPDGSNVWLNAESSLTMPSAFTGGERHVEISGEAYFEITENPKQPFTVSVSPMPGSPACRITVLGTHFNVDSYTDDNAIKTTLLQGSVRVSSTATNQSQILKPGQEAVLSHDNRLSVDDDPDAEDVVAWKNGLFKFRNLPIDEIMKQVARWYDVDVEYAGHPSEHFVSTLSRDVDLEHFLQTLQKTGQVHFTTEGRKVTVYPGPGQ